MKTPEELAKNYIESMPIGTYGKEYDAFLAGYIACLQSWERSTIGTNLSLEDESDSETT
jgi:hypothetical protein